MPGNVRMVQIHTENPSVGRTEAFVRHTGITVPASSGYWERPKVARNCEIGWEA